MSTRTPGTSGPQNPTIELTVPPAPAAPPRSQGQAGTGKVRGGPHGFSRSPGRGQLPGFEASEWRVPPHPGEPPATAPYPWQNRHRHRARGPAGAGTPAAPQPRRGRGHDEAAGTPSPSPRDTPELPGRVAGAPVPGRSLGPLAALQSRIIFSPFHQIYGRKMGSDFFLIRGWGEKYAASRGSGGGGHTQTHTHTPPSPPRFPGLPAPDPRHRRGVAAAGQPSPRAPANFLAPGAGWAKPPPQPARSVAGKYFMKRRSAVLPLTAAVDGGVEGPD